MQNVILKDDENYPELLRQIKGQAPKQLYYKTLRVNTSKFSCALAQRAPNAHRKPQSIHSNSMDIDQNIFDNCLAVVGSRKLTHYGEQVIEKIVGEVALAGITIVSGFMYGGDALAHQTALRVGGKTIAVMPCGIDRISPEDQEELYNDIIENNGMIISEYEGNMAPALWTYPRRNRIVAGLSKAVLVIEAGEKSGSLITANLSKKFNRKIFAVPGPITSSVSKGTNMLIKEGAEMVTDAKDILRLFRGKDKSSHSDSDKKTSHSKISSCFSPEGSQHTQKFQNTRFQKNTYDSENLSSSQKIDIKDTEEQIIVFLEREPLGINEMSRDLEISVSELGVKLSIMEMQGLIELKGDKYYNVK